METLNKHILMTLLNLAHSDVPASVQRLATELGLSRREIADELDVLASEGLVRAETCRLTFVGLMHATGLLAAARQQSEKGSQAA